MRTTVADWIVAVSDAERRGELLLAFDLAERGLEEHPEAVWLRHRAVLALARAGSTGEAQHRFDVYGLASVEDEDVQALGARIAKDIALAEDGTERRRLAAHAAALYGRTFEETGGYYPGINAATLQLLAGRVDEARRLARRVLDLLRTEDQDSYFVAATQAEAELLLGREHEARLALGRAAALNGGDFGALSTTRRQLRLVCLEAGFDPEILAGIGSPSVVHFCGHRIAPPGVDGRFPSSAEPLVAALITAEVDRDPPGFGYGSLANGADIMWAEALLRAGAELHVVLPFDRDEFLRTSVADGGGDWAERFNGCLSAATSVNYATDDAYLGDDVLYRYASELAMGLALLRARFLDAPVHQLAVWDRDQGPNESATATDVLTWSRLGHAVSVITPTGRPTHSPAPVAVEGETAGRVVRAMLFGDVKGFSKLSDEELPRFAEHVLGAMADVLSKYSEDVQFSNTWGDAVYVVLGDVMRAAACALDLQDAIAGLDLDDLHLPGHLALRLGAHIGPVFPIRDPVLDAPAFMGSHVSRTARIEPVTPPGSVFVTEAFAAALELANGRFSFDYVGHIPAAKDYGRLRMYRLRPA